VTPRQNSNPRRPPDEWLKGLMLIAAITGVPVMLLTIFKLLTDAIP